MEVVESLYSGYGESPTRGGEGVYAAMAIAKGDEYLNEEFPAPGSDSEGGGGTFRWIGPEGPPRIQPPDPLRISPRSTRQMELPLGISLSKAM